MHAYEKWMCHRYLARALSFKYGKHQRRTHDADFYEWLISHRGSVGLPDFKPVEEYESISARVRADWKSLQKLRSSLFAHATAPCPPISPLQSRIDWLSEACELDATQRSVLSLFARIARVPQIRALVAAVNGSNYHTDRFDYFELCPFFEAPISRKDMHDGFLTRFGLLEHNDGGDFWLSDLVNNLLSKRRLTPHQIGGYLLGQPAIASLDWDDFSHLGEVRDLAARILVHSDRNTSNGVNILVYGPPGTGKSEFVKTLAARCRLAAHFVGEENSKSCEPSRKERIAALTIANALAPVGKRRIVAVDEADDLFAGVDEDNAATRHGSKVFMHRLVERVQSPTIWIVNDIDRLGPAVVRRMNLVIRFPTPNLTVRKSMVERIAARSDFGVTAHEVVDLARYSASPALIENAIRSAARIEGSVKEASQILKCGLEAMRARVSVAPQPLAFDPALSSADYDLQKLAESIKNAKTRALSFCLSGPPGTGKSAYACYLAESLNLEILEKRYSDLSSAYIGETEKAIVRAFQEAADLRAFLIIDEVDSLLRDRSAARHSWEITEVNEMLTSMERHNYPFACTTNAPEILDRATARRFLFKVRFLPMTTDQVSAAFRRYFNRDAPESALKLTCLTPGDFAVVARKAEALGEVEPFRLARWLEEEAEAKPEAKTRRIGF